MEYAIGPVAAVPEDRCVAVADGRAVAVRVDGEVAVFPNRCLHQDSPLADGRVVDGRLQCPLHFWRYHLPSGAHTGGRGGLTSYPVTVVDGLATVDLPSPQPALSLRDQLLAHAQDWDRDAAPRPSRPSAGGCVQERPVR